MTYNPELETQLRLFVNGNEIAFPDRSALFTKTTIEPIEGAVKFRRTVNGRLVNLSNPLFNKWLVTTSGTDKLQPAISKIVPGSEAVYHVPMVIRELGNLPRRPQVPGSLVHYPDQNYIEYRPIVEGLIYIEPMSETEWMSDASWAFTILEH